MECDGIIHAKNQNDNDYEKFRGFLFNTSSNLLYTLFIQITRLNTADDFDNIHFAADNTLVVVVDLADNKLDPV